MIKIEPKNKSLLKSKRARDWFKLAERLVEREINPPTIGRFDVSEYMNLVKNTKNLFSVGTSIHFIRIGTHRRNEWNPRMTGWVSEGKDATYVKRSRNS